jgi:hypothetical protein
VPSNLPTPGRGGKLEVKLLVGEGAGHGVWKRIEGERGRWEETRRREGEEALREWRQALKRAASPRRTTPIAGYC